MAAKKKEAKPMTLAEKIQYGTSDTLELVSGWLGATPDMPGGCETVARFSLGKSRRLISVDLLSELRALAEDSGDLLAALEECLPCLGWESDDLEELQREHELGNGYAELIIRARAAIAKAKGAK